MKAVTYRARVRTGLVFLLLTAVSVPVAVAAVRASSTFTVDNAVVTANWKEGWLQPGAGVAFTGNVDGPSNLVASLRPLARIGVVTAKEEFATTAAGPFSKTLKLPARPLPGKYRLRVAGTTGSTGLAPVDLIVTVPAPPEGVLDRVLVGTSRSGPWKRYLNGSAPVVTGPHKILWMRFRFLYPPTGKKIELVWSQSWHKVIGKIVKRYANTIDTFAGSSQPLPKGHWLVVLTIDGRIAKKMDVLLR